MLKRSGQRAEIYELWYEKKSYENRVRACVDMQFGEISFKEEEMTEDLSTPIRRGILQPRNQQKPRGYFTNNLDFLRRVTLVIVKSLQELEFLSTEIEPSDVQITERSQGYLRVMVENLQSEEQENLLIQSLVDFFDNEYTQARYLIERHEQFLIPTSISKFFARFSKKIAAFFMRKETKKVSYHVVPHVMDGRKELASTFQRHWNEHVSIGKKKWIRRRGDTELLSEEEKALLQPHFMNYVTKKLIWV